MKDEKVAFLRVPIGQNCGDCRLCYIDEQGCCYCAGTGLLTKNDGPMFGPTCPLTLAQRKDSKLTKIKQLYDQYDSNYIDYSRHLGEEVKKILEES